jgi:hypothetical protein
LKVQPELRRGIQSLAKQPGCFRGNAALATNKFVHPLGRYPDVVCKLDLSDTERSQELLEKDLARVGRRAMGWDHGRPALVVIDYLNFEGV